MKLTAAEQQELMEFMANPFYKEIVENAPDEACRDYIVHGLIHGMYCGYDQEICKKVWKKD